jgi:preprotein translocase subunit SecF
VPWNELLIAAIGGVGGVLLSTVFGLIAYFYQDRMTLQRTMDERKHTDIQIVRSSSKARDEALNEQIKQLDDAIGAVSSKFEGVVETVKQNTERHQKALNERRRLEEKMTERFKQVEDRQVTQKQLSMLQDHIDRRFDDLKSFLRPKD